MQGGAVGWRREDEGDSTRVVAQSRARLASVTVHDAPPAGCAASPRMGKVVFGDGSPAMLVLHPERLAPGVHRLDQGGADAGHGIENDVSWRRVPEDEGARQLGQHPGRVGARRGNQALLALRTRRHLGHRENRQRGGHQAACNRRNAWRCVAATAAGLKKISTLVCVTTQRSPWARAQPSAMSEPSRMLEVSTTMCWKYARPAASASRIDAGD